MPLTDRVGGGGREPEGHGRVVQQHGVHGGQRSGRLAAGGHQVAQRAVEELRARRRGRTAQLDLDVLGDGQGADATATLEGQRSQRGRGEQAGAEQPTGQLLDTLLGGQAGSRVAEPVCSSSWVSGRGGVAACGASVIRCTPTASSGMTRFQPGWISRASWSLRPSGWFRPLFSS